MMGAGQQRQPQQIQEDVEGGKAANRSAKEGHGRERPGVRGRGRLEGGEGLRKKSANGTVELKELGYTGKVNGGKAHGAVGGMKSAVPAT